MRPARSGWAGDTRRPAGPRPRAVRRLVTALAALAVLGGTGAVMFGDAGDALAGDLGRLHIPFVGSGAPSGQATGR